MVIPEQLLDTESALTELSKNLELTPDEMRSFGYRVIDMLVERHANMRQSPVGAKAEPRHIRPLLASPPPDHPRDPNQLLDILQRDVFPNTLNVSHPRFFAFVPGPSNFVSAMGDALASGFNVFNGSWMGGSAAAALELEVIDWLRGFCGLPETAGGLFVSGGSVANLTALVAARRAILDDRMPGATIYYSDQTHSSVERALRVIGFQPEQIRQIPSDRQYRLPMDALGASIAADRAAGLRPFCVIANAGTTNTGAVDPLVELSELCRAEGMWLHADGAYGAAAILSERGRQALRGLDRVDSLSLDPHKWLFQSFECGCVLLRDVALLKRTFQIMPEYLRDVHRGVDEVHPADYGIQLTRSFRALKVWFVSADLRSRRLPRRHRAWVRTGRVCRARAAFPARLGDPFACADGNRVFSIHRPGGLAFRDRRCNVARRVRVCQLDQIARRHGFAILHHQSADHFRRNSRDRRSPG